MPSPFGSAAIKIGQRGRQHGDQRVLNAEQEKEIKRCLIDRTPESVRLLIRQKYGMNMLIWTVGEYLNRGDLPLRNLSNALMSRMPKPRIDGWQHNTPLLQPEPGKIKPRFTEETRPAFRRMHTGFGDLRRKVMLRSSDIQRKKAVSI